MKEKEAERRFNMARENLEDFHYKLKEDPRLPVPRLQIKLLNKKGGRSYFEYSLVMRHVLGYLECVPLGLTERYNASGRGVALHLSDLPFRDGSGIRHDMKQMNLPAFFIVGGELLEITEENEQ